MQTECIARARPIFSHPHMDHGNEMHTILTLITDNRSEPGRCVGVLPYWVVLCASLRVVILQTKKLVKVR